MFCAHTQIGVAVVDSVGNLRPCCRSRTFNWNDNKLPTIFEVDSLNELHKQKPYVNMRKELSQDIFPSICVECEIEENEGSIVSRRQMTNELFKNGLYVENTIQDLEISLDFTCNMMCRMCNPGQSSKWGAAKDLIKELNKHEMVIDLDQTNTEYRSYQEQMKYVLSNTDLSHLRFIKIEGGEPFYSKNFEWFLDKLHDEVIEPDKLEMMIITNGSVYPNKRVMDKLKGFPNLIISFSIDGIEELAECLRWGVGWEIIDSNIRKFKKHKELGELRITTNCVISILNFNKMKPLIKYLNDMDIDIGFTQLCEPNYLSMYQLPKDIRVQYLTGNHQIDDMLSADINIEPDFKRTLKHIELLDDHTNHKFDLVNKESLDIIRNNT